MRRMGPVCLIRLLLVLAFSHGQTARSDGPQDVIFHKYIIIGAGPGGLQLAHYLDSAGRDYLIIDKVLKCFG
jgi:NADPH-dependent glutamate synthase beta subunit-like oxidoreductase